MIDKSDAEEVIDLTLLEERYLPDIRHCVDVGLLAVGSLYLHLQDIPSARGAGQIIYHAHTLFPVHAHDGGKHIEAKTAVVAQFQGKIMPFLLGHIHQQVFSTLCKSNVGADAAENFLYIAHICLLV